MRILKTMTFMILYFIGVVVLATIIALGTLFIYFSVQMFLFGKGDYLLFVSSNSNMIPVIMLMSLFILYVSIKTVDKLWKKKENQTELTDDDEPINIETLGRLEKYVFKLLLNENLLNKHETEDSTISKIFKGVKILYLLVLVVAIYCGMTSYTILYPNNIKVSTPVNPAGVVYKYKEIQGIDVGVEKDRKTYSPYYKIIFNDDRSVDLFGGSMHEDKDRGFEYVLIDLDKELKSYGVSKRINKANFNKYSKDLNKDFISRIEILFEDK